MHLLDTYLHNNGRLVEAELLVTQVLSGGVAMVSQRKRFEQIRIAIAEKIAAAKNGSVMEIKSLIYTKSKL